MTVTSVAFDIILSQCRLASSVNVQVMVVTMTGNLTYTHTLANVYTLVLVKAPWRIQYRNKSTRTWARDLYNMRLKAERCIRLETMPNYFYSHIVQAAVL